MKDQNIFDNEQFFAGYKKLRENVNSANNLVEKPALFSLCPDFTNQRVLDLGCGYGENCLEFVRRQAAHVSGIDISEKMLATAKQNNTYDNVEFLQMSMSDLSKLQGPYDVILSSLAMHYIEDFSKLTKQVYDLLSDGGEFIFSQEHPLTTALLQEEEWTKDEKGNILYLNLSGYSELGERKSSWFVDGIIKYHRTFSDIIQTLLQNGFVIEAILEPMPSKEIMEKFPAFQRYLTKPDFLLLKVRKKTL